MGNSTYHLYTLYYIAPIYVETMKTLYLGTEFIKLMTAIFVKCCHVCAKTITEL